MNQQWAAPPADGDYAHYVERLNQQPAAGAPQQPAPAAACTPQQAAALQRAMRLAILIGGAILCIPVLILLLHAWLTVKTLGAQPALLFPIAGDIILLAFLAFVARICWQRIPDAIRALERNLPHAPPEP